MDQEALRRLREQFTRPKQPMGEAWFMSDQRRMFPELMGDLDQVTGYGLQQPLNEIASGTSSFGPMGEWTEWYHYLLAQALPRCHDGSVCGSIVESLVNGFMALYPNGVHAAPYTVVSCRYPQ